MWLHMFREGSSALEGFEELLGAAGLDAPTGNEPWEDVGRFFCFVLLWGRNETALITVNDNGKTRGNIQQTK